MSAGGVAGEVAAASLCSAASSTANSAGVSPQVRSPGSEESPVGGEAMAAAAIWGPAEDGMSGSADTRAQGAHVSAEPLIPSSAGPQIAAAAIASPPTGDSSEPGERTWGETPAEFAVELAALHNEAAATSPATPPADISPVEPPQPEVPAVDFEDTQPIRAMTEEQPAEVAAAPAGAAIAPIAAETAALMAQSPSAPEASDAPATTPADLEAEAASLPLLQRGVDLLNVSRVPHKIAETNEQLGLPSVHVGFDGQTTAVT